MADELRTGRWRTDPSGRHEYRYWDGTRWTDHVADNGLGTTDSGAIPSLSAWRRYVAGVIDWTLLVAAVFLLFEAFGGQGVSGNRHWEGSIAIVWLAWTALTMLGSGLGGAVCRLRVVTQETKEHLNLVRAGLRAAFQLLAFGAIGLIAVGIGLILGIQVAKALGYGEWDTPLGIADSAEWIANVSAFAFALLVPPLVETGWARLHSGRAPWDRVARCVVVDAST